MLGTVDTSSDSWQFLEHVWKLAAQYKYHIVISLNCDVCPYFLRGKSRAGFFFDVIIVTW